MTTSPHLHHIERFYREATDAGVHPQHLAAFRDAEDNATALRDLAATLADRDPIADVLATGKLDQLEDAVRTDATDTVMLRSINHYLENMVKGEQLTVHRVFADDQVVDNILADLSTTLTDAFAGLAPLVDRWGSDEPDAARVAAEATADELKAYRNRRKHQAARDKVFNLATQLVTRVHAPLKTFAVLTIPNEQSIGGKKTAWRWLFHDDGTTRTILEARRRINAMQALDEISRHQRSESSNPRFVPKFTVHPDHYGTATFRHDGRPTDDVVLLDDETFRTLFGTDSAEGRAYRTRLQDTAA